MSQKPDHQSRRSPWAIYDALIDEALGIAVSPEHLRQVTLGINWSMASFSDFGQPGLCFSPAGVARTLPWAGTLADQSFNELVRWIKSWNGAESVVAATLINAVINSHSALLSNATQLDYPVPGHLQVFEHFRPQLTDKHVVVVGHYPGLEKLQNTRSWQCVDMSPREGDLPAAASPYVMENADWVFITASSIANKTLPQLLRWSAHATVVLMGPSLPWSSLWADYSIDYLAGVYVESKEDAFEVVTQAGGTQLFNGPCHYRCLSISS